MFNVNNCCQFEGRLVKDPEFKTVGQGNNTFTKALFTIAVDRQLSKEKKQQKKNDPNSVVSADFPQFVALGAKAEFLKNYFSKGKPIKIWASYQSYSSQDPQTGNRRFGHIFQVEELGFTISDTSGNNGGNTNNNGGGNYGRQNNRQANNNVPPANNRQNIQQDYYPVADGDIPF